MSIFSDLYYSFCTWLEARTSQISIAVIATLLVIYGDNINRLIKKNIRHNPFAIRVLIFICVCAFGYGSFTLFAAGLLDRFFQHIPRFYLFPAAAAAFITVGILAERENHI